MYSKETTEVIIASRMHIYSVKTFPLPSNYHQLWTKATKYFIGPVTLFFANNYLTEYLITMEFLYNIS